MTRLITHTALFTALLSMSSIAYAAEPETAAEAPLKAAIELGAPFCDHMVLQRDMKVPVWGWSKPGDTITVEFAGQKKAATAAEDGRWMVQLDPLKASAEPAEVVITDSSGRQEVLKDILVGEVWMCSGQSNMQWPAEGCIVGRKLIPEIKARVEAGEEKQPIIREGKVTDVFSSLYPTDRAKGQWSDDWNSFSAIAFAFAYEIAREVQVPVGIVNCVQYDLDPGMGAEARLRRGNGRLHKGDLPEDPGERLPDSRAQGGMGCVREGDHSLGQGKQSAC